MVQMFVNVIENSIRHCPQGSVIGVELKQADGRLIVDVTDDGPGIPDTEHERVFDRMFRLDKSRTAGGSGLGLSLVAAIADLHAAEVSLVNEAPGVRVRVAFASAVRVG